MTIVTVAYLLFLTAGSLQACGDGWVPFRGNCYMFATKQMNWFQAKQYCASLGGTLASIETKEENDWLKMQLYAFNGGKGYQAFIGGNDLVRKSDWRWEATNGPLSIFNDWGPGEPHELHGKDQQRCTMITSGALYYGWADVVCEIERKRTICEKKDYPA